MLNNNIEIRDVKVHSSLTNRATVAVKGITKENYSDNRVFRFEGKRWVLQGSFGWDCMDGVTFFMAEQHDGDGAETIVHFVRGELR